MSNSTPHKSLLPPEIQIEIHSRDPNVVTDLCGFNPEPGNSVDILPGSQLRYYGSPERSGAWPGLPEIYQFGLTVAAGVTAKVLGEWIFDRIKGKKAISELRINRRLTEFSAEGIQRVIEESIEFKSDSK